MSLIWPAKDPDEVADYTVDWTARLAGDTIATSAFALDVAAGLTKDSDSNTTTAATVWLSGGTAGGVATIRNTVTTAAGRTLEEEILLPISSGLVVEDGTGKADAEAFASVETADAYCAKRGIAFTGTKAEKEAALRVGAERLTTGYRFKGYRANGRAQALPFPRLECTDEEGEEIASDEVPIEVVHANIELAAYERANPGGLNPAVVPTERIKAEGIGPMRVEYQTAASTPDQARPVLLRVDDLIGGLLDSAGGSSLGGVAHRV